MTSQTFGPHYDSDKQTFPCVNVVWESGVSEHFDVAFINIFARKSNTQVKKNLRIALGTSQTFIKIQRIDRERQYYCLKDFKFAAYTAEPLET